uniref:RRM domain-containing protein n=1 Tax=Strigamia maritima TaxID=126957 RepID=T1JAF6_STRMM
MAFYEAVTLAYKEYLRNNNHNILHSESNHEKTATLKGGDTKLNKIRAKKRKLDEEITELKQMEAARIEELQTPGPSSSRSPEVDSRTISIGNLDDKATTEELQQYFQECGPINEITIPIIGFARIEFANIDSVFEALALMDQTIFRERRIEVRAKMNPKTYEEPVTPPPPPEPPIKRRKLNNNSKILKAQTQQLKDEIGKLNERKEEIERRNQLASSDYSSDSRTIYVGNMDPSTTTDELERHFETCGQINRVSLLFNKLTGKPKGCAFIDFAKFDSVSVALLVVNNLPLLRGRRIRVEAKRIYPLDKAGSYSLRQIKLSLFSLALSDYIIYKLLMTTRTEHRSYHMKSPLRLMEKYNIKDSQRLPKLVVVELNGRVITHDGRWDVFVAGESAIEMWLKGQAAVPKWNFESCCLKHKSQICSVISNC